MLQIMFSWWDIDPVYYLVTLLCSIAFFLQPNIFGIGLSILLMMYHKKHSFNLLFSEEIIKVWLFYVIHVRSMLYNISFAILGTFSSGASCSYVGDSKLSFFHRFFFMKTLNQQRIYFYVIVPFELKLKAGGLCTWQNSRFLLHLSHFIDIREKLCGDSTLTYTSI